MTSWLFLTVPSMVVDMAADLPCAPRDPTLEPDLSTWKRRTAVW